MGIFASKQPSISELRDKLNALSVSDCKAMLNTYTDDQLQNLAVASIGNRVFNHIIALNRVNISDDKIFTALCLRDDEFYVSRYVKQADVETIDYLLLHRMHKLSSSIIRLLWNHSSLSHDVIGNECVLHYHDVLDEFEPFELTDYTMRSILVNDNNIRLNKLLPHITNHKDCLRVALELSALDCAKSLIKSGKISNLHMYDIIINSGNNEAFNYLITYEPPNDKHYAFALAVTNGNVSMATILAKNI